DLRAELAETRIGAGAGRRVAPARREVWLGLLDDAPFVVIALCTADDDVIGNGSTDDVSTAAVGLMRGQHRVAAAQNGITKSDGLGLCSCLQDAPKPIGVLA